MVRRVLQFGPATTLLKAKWHSDADVTMAVLRHGHRKFAVLTAHQPGGLQLPLNAVPTGRCSAIIAGTVDGQQEKKRPVQPAIHASLSRCI